MNEYDFPKSFGFTVLANQYKICHVVVNGEEVETKEYSRYYECRLYQHYLYFVETKKREDVIRFLMTRTVSETLWRWPQVYGYVGIKEYLPYEYIRKLHGVFNTDGFWLYFDDDWLDASFRPPMYGEQGCELFE